MIKANELRIGNIIIDGIDGEFATPFVVAAANIGFAQIMSDNHYEPIPITEEWLERMGFKRVGGWHVLYLGEQRQFIRGGVDTKGVSLFDPEHMEIGKAQIYVHQLQNLYFALTGEELTIRQPA